METNLRQELKIKLKDLLSEDYTVRGASVEDVEASLELYNQWSRSVIGRNEVTDAEAIRNEWVSPGFDPAEDIRLVFDLEGKLAGYIEVWTTSKPPVHPWIWGRVHPDHNGNGIGTYMLKWAEHRAMRVLEELDPDLRFAPRIGAYRQAEGSRRFFEEHGYRHIRSGYEMMIEMDSPPPVPRWPQGISVRTYNPDTDAEAVYRTDMEAFRDHFGFVEEPFEEGFARFNHFMTGYKEFDPSLWFLALEGTELVGICLCRPHAYDDPDVGHVSSLGVRRPWRKRGLGLAFLHHAFGEFYRRGKHKVNLGVDAENLTGALRLYEKAGMHVHEAFDTYEKEIRPGKEISVQSLAE